MKSKNKLKDNHYENIYDLPVYNWWRINSTGDLQFMLHKKRELTKKEIEYLVKVWDKISDEFISKFGIGKDYLDILHKRIYIAELQLDVIINDNRSATTLIDIAKIELEEMKKKAAQQEFLETKAMVEKQVGFQIDIRTMSVAEYFMTIKSLDNGRKTD